MRYAPMTTLITLFGLLVLVGCQSSPSRETVDAPLHLNAEGFGLSDRSEPFDGVKAFVRSLKWNKDGSYQAIEGEDLKLSFYFSVMTRQGAFVREGNIGLKDEDPVRFVGTRIPKDKGWDVINDDGSTVGRLHKERDDPFYFGSSTLFGGHARRNWSHIEGHETSDAIDPNIGICCWSFVSDITLPFSEIEPTGDWGTVKIPMWVSVFYYDIAEQRYKRAHRKFDLAIEFKPASADH